MGAQDINTDSSLSGQVLIDQKNGQILFFPTEAGSDKPLIMAGNFVGRDGKTTGAGLKVAKAGIDVRDATNEQLIFNSNQNVFKVVSSSTASNTPPNLAQDGNNTLTIAHNLGYIPAATAYLNGTGSPYLVSNRYYPLPLAIPIKIGSTYYPGLIYEFMVDINNIYLSVTNQSALNPVTIGTNNWKYYLLQETAA